MIQSSAGGIEIDVLVIPRAGKTVLAGERDGCLLVRLAAPPVEGAANDALILFLANLLDVPRRDVRIIAGARGRKKRIAVAGVTAGAAQEQLSPGRGAR